MPVTACSRSLPRQGLHDAVELWRPAARARSTTGARPSAAPTASRSTPCASGRSSRPRRPPEWSTPHEIVREWPLARLRDFTRRRDRRRRPDARPPAAGRPRLLHRRLQPRPEPDADDPRGRARPRSTALDWIGATQATKDATIDDYLGRSSTPSGRPRSAAPSTSSATARAAGWPTIYAALHPERVNTLTIAGAPIDFHGGDAADPRLASRRIGRARLLPRPRRPGRRRAEGRVHARRLHRHQAARTRSASSCSCSADLGDAGTSTATARFEDWFKHTQDIAGRLLPVDRRAPVPRQRARRTATLQIGGEPVDLGRDRLPASTCSPAPTDHITPPDQVFALADAVVHPAERTSRGAERRRPPRACSWVTRRFATTGLRCSQHVLEHSTARGAAASRVRPVNDS